MLSRFRRGRSAPAEFPTVADLPNLSPQDATAAIGALRALVDADLASVYHPLASPAFNVWLNDMLDASTGFHGVSMTLADWAQSWIATPPSGGAA